ncbi:MAG: hypothetical protein RLY14_613 [Planctomycetota bacterium]|jgi:mono/diheme cytochrome c family protein
MVTRALGYNQNPTIAGDDIFSEIVQGKRMMRPFTFLLLLTLSISITDHVSANEAEQLFVRRILPLLNDKCFACHGKDKIEGGLDLRSRQSILKGGDSGNSAMAERMPQLSGIILAVTRSDPKWSAMPPKESEQLSKEQIGWLSDWIEAGAPWPDEAKALEIARVNEPKWLSEDGIIVETSAGLSTQWTNRRYNPKSLWAYQPVKMPTVDPTLTGSNTRNPIDLLVEKQLPKSLTVADDTDARTFIRRATFDLTGLPPTPEDVETFVKACRSSSAPTGDPSFSLSTPEATKAIASLIDQLLASPHYGEQMAQHWLDVTRYADSSGLANDYERGNAWRYRDYVIRAFNDDKPYDQFVKEQIAGDEIDPYDPEKIIATGFLRMGPWELTGMEVEKVARQRFLDDIVNSVGETFLAHPLQCARCHDHKFDPIPTRDYYSIQAVFATTQSAERSADFLPTENTTGFGERRYLEQIRDDHERALQHIDDLLLKNAQQWFAENGKSPKSWNEAVDMAREKLSPANNKLPSRPTYSDVFASARKSLLAKGIPESNFPPKLVGLTPNEFGLERVARKGLERLKWELDRYEPYALAVYSGRTREYKTISAPTRMPENRFSHGEIETSCIHIGGDPFVMGELVQPGVLSILKNVSTEIIPEELEGRRKAFAQWVANANNPLTTRTIVNRIWLWHFNQPIAGNPNNFGSTGKQPTHPELLDYLAATFVEKGWSFKSLHRLIMTSAAYRRKATHYDPQWLKEKDYLTASYAVFKPRRLSAEELKDTLLSVSGELNPILGGIPNRPEINMEVALQPRQVMGTFATAWTPNPRPEQRHRRSIYALKLRGLADPMMEVFNSPPPDFSCEFRDANTITPQVFSLFNSNSSYTRSLAIASRVLRETATEEDAVQRCFALILGRPAKASEIHLCISHWHNMRELQQKIIPTSAKPPTEILREAVEENTGERFTFSEKLYSNADFIPDIQPVDCDPNTRALADVCLSLINTNEFAYVY